MSCWRMQNTGTHHLEIGRHYLLQLQPEATVEKPDWKIIGKRNIPRRGLVINIWQISQQHWVQNPEHAMGAS